MALTFDELAALPNGARFVLADLHIHSIASTDDVSRDSGMTSTAIIDTALAERVEIISITDHNSIAALPEAMSYAKQFSDRLLLIPGIELTANEGHVLAYFDPAEYEQLERFTSSLDIIRDTQGSRVRASIIEIIRSASKFGGYCVAAHIDTPIGFEVGNPGFPAWKKDLLTEPGLRGLEFRNPANHTWYSVEELEGSAEAAERRKYAQARVDSGVRANGALARFHNSDAHEMAHLRPPRGLNRIKVTALSFDAFRAALADPEARIRINELVPRSIPRLIGLGINGGFLDQTNVRFSDNLNIFFGGRGTGKSTAVRALAFAFNQGEASMQHPPFQSVSVFCEDANGVAYRFDRAAGGDVVGRFRKEGSIAAISADEFPIEYYGQGELGRVAQQSLVNSIALQDFLDKHIGFEGLLERAEQCGRDARDIATQLAPLVEVQLGRIPLIDQLDILEERLKASENSKIKQVAEFTNQSTAEKSLRGNIVELTSIYRRGISLKSLMREPKELRALSRVTKCRKATAPAFDAIDILIDEANDFLVKSARNINEYLVRAAAAMNEQIEIIDSHHVAADDQVQKYVEQLREKGLASNIAELNDLSKRKSMLVAQITRIDAQKAAHDDLQLRFNEQLGELGQLRAAINEKRKVQRSDLNAGFNRDKYGRFDVFLIPDTAYAAPEFLKLLSDKLEGSYYQSESINKLPSQVDPTRLAKLLDEKDVIGLSEIQAIDAKWAQTFVERLGDAATTLYLRTITRVKPPRFKVIERATKSEIPFSYLSDGQKHTVMLTIALLAGSRYPLIIDQPEDDLDNKFIAERVVKTLRDVKENRQVIIVTHNANIAVLGDSEQLLAMDNTDSGEGHIASRGSIDDSATKLAVQNCLEGGVDAFRRRYDVYGI